MTLERLTRMGLSEIVGRGRQQTTRWLERFGIAGSPAWGASLRGPGFVQSEALRSAASVRFFEGGVDAAVPALLMERMPSSCAEILAEADAILQGRFRLLGHRDLQIGSPIDWHQDPLSRRRADIVHYSQLDPLEPVQGGDCKLLWELNRHQWFVRLGQAYRLTEDDRYARAFTGHLESWMQANPPGTGINWSSSLEVSLRLIAWSWSLFLFSDSRRIDSRLLSLLIGGIATHAAHVERNLSYYFSPNTHLTGEALALFYAGTLFPEIRQARRWRDLGTRILEQEIERQVLPDGVYFEQSTCYLRYTLDIYLHFMILAQLNRRPVAQSVRDRVGLMLDFIAAVRRPDGSVPQIGDADGGRLLPLTAGTFDDFSAVLSTAAAVLGRGDVAPVAHAPRRMFGCSAETVWLLGREGLDRVVALGALGARDARRGQSGGSRLFPNGGYAVMTSDAPDDGHQLIFDVGPLGCPITAGHGHADLLSIQASVFGQPCLVDPGTYCYTTDSKWRDYFRSAAAHSTLILDGESPARPAGPFSWQERPEARLRQWQTSDALDFADAEHDAYSRLSDPVVHRRRVLFVKPRFWIIVDDLAGSKDHTIDLRYQFAPGYSINLERTPWIAAHRPSGRGLLAIVYATTSMRPRAIKGCMDPIGGWVSPDFGVRLPAPGIGYRAGARLPVRMATLMFPVEEIGAPLPRIAPLMSEGPSLRGFALDGGKEFLIIDDQEIRLERR